MAKYAHEPPFVSIVVPVLDCAGEVEGCVRSLRDQDYPPNRYEIIVVDNGSSDGTREILLRTNVTLFVREERGRSRALNTGLEHAKGEIICTTDVSCRPEPNWLRAVVESFSDPAVACVAGEIKLLKTADNAVLDFQQSTNYMSPMLALNRDRLPFLPFADGANASFRKSLFDEIGPFDETFVKGADVEICYRMFVLTDYKIVFNRDAVVWEPGEPTWKALLSQRSRMGLGSRLMRMKYPGLYRANGDRAPLRRIYWSLRGVLRQLKSLAAAGAPGADPDPATFLELTIRWLMSLSQRLGSLYAPWYLRSEGIRPEPVDEAAIRAFVSSQGQISERLRVSGGVTERQATGNDPATAQ